MNVEVSTPCRICGQRFAEYVNVEPDGRCVTVEHREGHDIENGAAWCPKCRSRIEDDAARLICPPEPEVAPTVERDMEAKLAAGSALEWMGYE